MADLFLSREDDDDIRDIGKDDFGSVLLHPMLSNANHLFYVFRSRKAQISALNPFLVLFSFLTLRKKRNLRNFFEKTHGRYLAGDPMP